MVINIFVFVSLIIVFARRRKSYKNTINEYPVSDEQSMLRFSLDEDKRALLTWEVRFRIIEGIARGLLYLHEDSQLKIIHRDLKLSSILLDAEMNPKFSDFGTARLFETDVTRAETRRIAGTRGYMAPEYLKHGQISAKSDVYSFGALLLEMKETIASKDKGLAAFAWKRWVEGKPESIIDPFLIEDPRNKIVKMIQIGFDTIIIPLPNAHVFSGSESQSKSGTMSMSNIFTELGCR
ncbi:cysteine-rich receptor-like protein kinase 40 [Capsella rubella]|uniref:cysteine-rich receptor-like protein kinase 40 n=1 Tax=Capsella rubella TaxID=81985 RepID=UPI000CD4D910|nr:cysteine-rich receptor-like protein kinase 40 [Capsella rubella]